MAVVLPHPQLVEPPSPALTNPDMILPYNLPLQDNEPNSGKPAQSTIAAELTPPQVSRPTLPGAWYSEEDVKASIPNDNHLRQPDVPILTLKSPVGRFLKTLDPSTRAGIGIEAPEYSPSIYSPTDPEGRTPIGQGESPFPEDLSGNSKSMFDEEDEDDDVMGARAEEILANAKQRLLAMENNLNRARTLSLGTANSEVVSPIEDRPFTFKPQKSNGNPNHLRISSESKVPNGKPVYDPTIRSASALGSPNPFSSFVHRHHHLEPLNEDDLIDSSSVDYDQPKTSMRDLQEQMNNLKGKINSLKERSREDSLRRRSLQALKAPSPFTNADVSARSPFIEHMRPESNSSDRSAEFLGNPKDVIREFDSPQPSPLVQFKPEDNESSHGGTFFEDEAREERITIGHQGDRRSIVIPPSKEPDLGTPASQQVVFDHVESAEPESIIPSSPTYETDFLNPDLPPMPKSTSPAHEDRPDAFDYETYILNSTMGSFSRAGFRSSSNSISSEDSASTQRPPENVYENSNQHHSHAMPTRAPHNRTDSADSASTTGTFATAYTGRNDSRVNSRASRHKGAGYLSTDLPPKSSYTNLRQGVSSNLGVPESPQKRNSFSPLPSPNTSAFPTQDVSTALTPSEARTQILAILLRSASSYTPASTNGISPKVPDRDSSRCWAPEDEHLVGTVVDGLIKVVSRVVKGDDEGGAGRSILESIGAVLQK